MGRVVETPRPAWRRNSIETQRNPMNHSLTGLWAMALAGTTALAACSDDDDMVVPPQMQTFEVSIENVAVAYDFASSGVFDTPAGQGSPGPLFPGGVYEFSFHAGPGAYLSFATMMVQSNDFFFAPDGDGIALWNPDGSQVTGDVTDQILLWDAGTEADGEPGLGPDQAPRQTGADTGAPDPNATVRLAADAFANLPAIAEMVRVTLMSTGPTSWTARIENVSTATTLATSDGAMHPVPLAPGVFVVHSDPNPLFTVGSADRGEGLEGVAEDGTTGDLRAALGSRTGATGVLAPGVYAVHRTPSILFEGGAPDRGLGLEAIAEDGAPGALAGALAGDPEVSASDLFNTPAGAAAPGPATPGGRYTFTVTAEEGDRLSFATMYVQSNDLFFAPAETGIDLFPGGVPLSGDVTGMVLLWDAGTEVNERPGVGLFQAPRQPGPDTGADENGSVRQVNDGYDYGDVEGLIRVTVTPIG